MPDPAGDAGLLTPPYVDVVRVSIEDDGSRARVVVDVAGALPQQLPADEVAGVGVDLYVGDRPSSDYQVFADGSPDGWFAYLYAEGDLVRYPGSFALGGSRMVFELPWNTVGDRAVARFSAFYDWSKDAVPVNRVGEDHAPATGTAPLRRP
ncbi:MAG TPA: hypothetical protein VNA57_12210 [Acidimicrobiales bacterium]|nr:hypothetical protein [Acidimicrobiales bacterium]